MDRRDLDYEVYIGIDVGKSSDYLVALPRDSDEPILEESVRQSEPEIRLAQAEASSHGRSVVCVDQCDGFGLFAVRCARSVGLDVVHIPPRSFRRLADAYGEDKTDPIDARIIAQACRTAPWLVEPLPERSEVVAEIRVLSQRRAETVRDRTRRYNGMHALLQMVSPALEELFSGNRLHSALAIDVPAAYGGPNGLRDAGEQAAAAWASELPGCGARGPRKVSECFAAIADETVTVPAAQIIEREIMREAAKVRETNEAVSEYDVEIERLCALAPEVSVLNSVPSIGRVYAAGGAVGQILEGEEAQGREQAPEGRDDQRGQERLSPRRAVPGVLRAQARRGEVGHAGDPGSREEARQPHIRAIEERKAI